MPKKVELKLSSRILRKKTKRSLTPVKRHCRFVNNPELVHAIDYKNADFLKSFLTERGKILPARISGNSSKYQRLMAHEIKKARTMALLPYTTEQF